MSTGSHSCSSCPPGQPWARLGTLLWGAGVPWLGTCRHHPASLLQAAREGLGAAAWAGGCAPVVMHQRSSQPPSKRTTGASGKTIINLNFLPNFSPLRKAPNKISNDRISHFLDPSQAGFSSACLEFWGRKFYCLRNHISLSVLH